MQTGKAGYYQISVRYRQKQPSLLRSTAVLGTKTRQEISPRGLIMNNVSVTSFQWAQCGSRLFLIKPLHTGPWYYSQAPAREVSSGAAGSNIPSGSLDLGRGPIMKKSSK